MNHEAKPARDSISQLLPFTLDGRKCALDVRVVDRIIPLVEVTPLPNSPEIVLGLVNVGGQIVPVVDLRQRLGLPQAEAELSARLIIARTAKRAVALPVDSVDGVIERSAGDVTEPGKVIPGTQLLKGFTKLDGSILLIHNLEAFLSLEEESRLREALDVNGISKR